MSGLGSSDGTFSTFSVKFQIGLMHSAQLNRVEVCANQAVILTSCIDIDKSISIHAPVSAPGISDDPIGWSIPDDKNNMVDSVTTA